MYGVTNNYLGVSDSTVGKIAPHILAVEGSLRGINSDLLVVSYSIAAVSMSTSENVNHTISSSSSGVDNPLLFPQLALVIDSRS
jgi:hypothetical protein